MTYDQAKAALEQYSGIIGKPLLNKMVYLDDRRITSLLISPADKIRAVYTEWYKNGNDNKKAVLHKKQNQGFEVFLISHVPTTDPTIYYLRLSKYVQLGK